MTKLEREFYNRSSVDVAQDLLGKYLVHVVGGTELIGKIVETEAYMGPSDKAAHSYNNRRTARTEVMYGPPGYAYVFSIYGMHFCMNVVTEEKGKPQAVLIRALEPVAGADKMAEYRFKKPLSACSRKELAGLTNGPGKLCEALQITKAENGSDLCSNSMYILQGRAPEEHETVTTARINIDYAGEAIHYPWRFYIKGNKHISC